MPSQLHFSEITSSNEQGAYRNLKRNLARRYAGDPDLLRCIQFARTLDTIIEALARSYLRAFNIVHQDSAAGACDRALRDHAWELAEDREDAMRAIMTFFDRRVIETSRVTVRLTGADGIRITATRQGSMVEPYPATA